MSAMGERFIREREALERRDPLAPFDDESPFDDEHCASCGEAFSLQLGEGVAHGTLNGLCTDCSKIAEAEIAERLADMEDTPW